VNREAELDRPSRVACSDLLDHVVIISCLLGKTIIQISKQQKDKRKQFGVEPEIEGTAKESRN